ncbi:MAG: DUF3617 family protein [Pseudomonadota bacterium]
MSSPVQKKTSLCSVVLLLAAGLFGADAGAIEVKPGKWAVNSITTTPMSTQPVNNYMEECVEEAFDPVAEMVKQGEAQQCTITNVQDSANQLDADLQCTMPGVGSVQGKMSFIVNDSAGTGQLNMSMNLGGQVLQMSTSWTGEYLGESCN